MSILEKHKKEGIDGFKDFVKFLEVVPEDKAKHIIQLGLLEDPVYMKCVLDNLVNFNYIKNLDEENMLSLHNQLPNPLTTFLYAFYNSELEGHFLAYQLNDNLKKRYIEERELTKKVTAGQQLAARRSLMGLLHKLQNYGTIPDFKWIIPSSKILKGENFRINGKSYEMDFEDGTRALRGNVENKARNGKWQHYYPNGQLMAEGIYLYGEKAGNWVLFSSNGSIKSEGQYKENLKEGTWVEYDSNGNQSDSIYLHGKKVE